MVPSEWDPALRFVCGSNFVSDLIGESPVVSRVFELFERDVLIRQAPPNLHPFVSRVYFNTCLLVRIPGLFV